jgi:hypothetical protein
MPQKKYLYSLSKIITPSLLLNDRLKEAETIGLLQSQMRKDKYFLEAEDTHLVYLSSGNVVIPRQSYIYETLIIPQIQINLQIPHVR